MLYTNDEGRRAADGHGNALSLIQQCLGSRANSLFAGLALKSPMNPVRIDPMDAPGLEIRHIYGKTRSL